VFDIVQPKQPRNSAKHGRGSARQSGVGTDRISLIADLTRTLAMLLLAWLLILVGLPAVVAALGT